MKLKSETKQVIAFLKNKQENHTVLQTCRLQGLNYDMVCRGLQRLHAKNVINRETRGPNSTYEYPQTIALGDVIHAIQGIELETHSEVVKQALNSIKI